MTVTNSELGAYINAQTEDTSPDTAADFVVTYDASASGTKKVKLANVSGAGVVGSGWVSDANTWSYSSADSPTFVISVNADLTGVLSPGMRIKLTQTTVKYFIVTAVGAYSGGATLVTVYGGTDYTLANAAITLPYYSTVKAPFGFPLDPAKWTVRVTDTSDRTQATPTQNTWYNLNSNAISIPIGVWRVSYEATIANYSSTPVTSVSVSATLSTANNSESDKDFSARTYLILGSAAAYIEGTVRREKFLTLAAKTSYYLNLRTVIASTSEIDLKGSSGGTTIIEAVCAYL